MANLYDEQFKNRLRMHIYLWITNLFKKEDRSSKCWCECGHETLQDPLSKIYEGGTFTNIICSKCNRQTTWDLDAPVPWKISSMAAVVVLSILLSPIATAQTPKPAKPKHAMAKALSIAASPVTHPKRTLKQVFGSVLFAVETGVDGARVGLEGADKVFDALSIQGKVPILDQIYAVVSIGAKDAAKADLWLEKEETSLFGTHN